MYMYAWSILTQKKTQLILIGSAKLISKVDVSTLPPVFVNSDIIPFNKM